MVIKVVNKVVIGCQLKGYQMLIKVFTRFSGFHQVVLLYVGDDAEALRSWMVDAIPGVKVSQSIS